MKMDTSSQQDGKVEVDLEVVLKPTSTVRRADAVAAIQSYFQAAPLRIVGKPFQLPRGSCPFADEHVESLIATVDARVSVELPLLAWDVTYRIIVYRLAQEGPADDDEGAVDGVPSFREWELPSRDFHGQWENLHYDIDIKDRLLRYAQSAMLFSDMGVDPGLISWNRVVLLHGPPGTGKTSLCQALAQKLSVRLSHRYRQGQLVEVNAHSLFSKWFSESGKLVSKLFARIQEMVEEEDVLVFVLIDEVESLTAARKAAVSGSEPSDAIRAVNALLTQLDALRARSNVMVLTTSNITEAVDLAFVDRTDIKAFIGHPPLQARYEILRSCVAELQRAGVVADAAPASSESEERPESSLAPFNHAATEAQAAAGAGVPSLSAALLAVASACEGFSGRLLRKLPFLAHTLAPRSGAPTTIEFLQLMGHAAQQEIRDRSRLSAA